MVRYFNFAGVLLLSVIVDSAGAAWEAVPGAAWEVVPGAAWEAVPGARKKRSARAGRVFSLPGLLCVYFSGCGVAAKITPRVAFNAGKLAFRVALNVALKTQACPQFA